MATSAAASTGTTTRVRQQAEAARTRGRRQVRRIGPVADADQSSLLDGLPAPRPVPRRFPPITDAQNASPMTKAIYAAALVGGEYDALADAATEHGEQGGGQRG